MADNKDYSNDPYDRLKGYFPKELDLSPEELEKEILTENKQRDIALNMTMPKTSAEGLEPDAAVQSDAPAEAVADPEYDDANEGDIQEQEENDDEYIDDPEPDDEKDVWTPPIADEVTENDLLNKYASLDSLLESLEEDAETKTENDKHGDGKMMDALSWMFDFLEIITVCMACIILVFAFFGRLTRVDGPSMEDSLQDGQLLIISDFAYTPKAGDIVVFQNTSLSMERLRNPLVKRIIAVGGQSIDITSEGKVTVTDENGNSRELDQSFTKNETYRGSNYHCKVPEGYVFVMGDNRNDSTDSRDPHVGLVDERCIFGHAVLRVSPLSEFTLFKNPYEN